MSSLLCIGTLAAAIQDAAPAAADGRIRFSGTITVGNILTTVSVLVSALALWITWIRDIRLRETEYADRVRTAAASTVARLERAREITSHFFDVFEMSFVRANQAMAKGERTAIEIKDFVWRKAEKAAEECKKRLLEEEIELAYVDLYAYDADVYETFVEARRQQQRIWERIFTEAKVETGKDILMFGRPRDGLRNHLRESSSVLSRELRDEMEAVLTPLHERLEAWIRAPERDIVRRRVRVARRPAPVPDRRPPAGEWSRVVDALARGAAHARLPRRRGEVELAYGKLRYALQELAAGDIRIVLGIERLVERPASEARRENLIRLMAIYPLANDPGIGVLAGELLDALKQAA